MTTATRERELELQAAELDAEIERRSRIDPAAFFPWHTQQQTALGIEADVTIIDGGSQSGKSTTLKGIVAQILQRRSPYTPRLGPGPYTFWIAPQSLEKARADWVEPTNPRESLRHWMGELYADQAENPDLVFYSTKGDQLWMKSQEQGFMSFESSRVHVAVFDEEPKETRVVTSAFLRLATTHGIMLFGFTPLRGLTWSHKWWWKPLVEMGQATKIGDRAWVGLSGRRKVAIVQMGMADNPAAREAALDIEADPHLSEAEKRARLYGEYGFVAGALYPRLAGMDLKNPAPEHQIYVLDELPKRKLTWYLVADPNRRYGAVLVAGDGDGNWIFTHQHLREDLADWEHARGLKKMEKEANGPVFYYADPGSTGKQSMVNLNALGLPFEPVHKFKGSVARSIQRFRGLTVPNPDHRHPLTKLPNSPRVFFHRPTLLEEWEEDSIKITGSRLVDQLGSARQKEDAPPDTPDQPEGDLHACGRYLTLVAPELADEGTKTRRERDPDHLRTDQEDPNLNVRRNPLELDFYLPEYDFVMGAGR